MSESSLHEEIDPDRSAGDRGARKEIEMRRLTEYEFMGIDGVVQAPGARPYEFETR